MGEVSKSEDGWQRTEYLCGV